MRRIPVSIDERTLQEIAEITGGEYFRATDTDSLADVYARIDELERTEIEQRRYTDYREASVEPITLAGVTLPPLLAVAVVLLGIEVLLRNTRFRTLP
jgi:Ca-activated chloride channel family protein